MKTILYTLFVMTFISSNTIGQNNREFDNFYRYYKGSEGIVTFKISPDFFSLLINKEEKELKDILKKIDDISFFIADSAYPSMFSDLKNNLPEIQYKNLMVIRDGASTVTFKAKESMNGVEEIIMTACEPESIFVLCISGVFDREDAKNLAHSIKVGNTISFHQGLNDDH